MAKQDSKTDTKENFDIQAFKIIIIEDDEGLGKLIQLTLNREGFITDLAEKAAEA